MHLLCRVAFWSGRTIATLVAVPRSCIGGMDGVARGMRSFTRGTRRNDDRARNGRIISYAV